MGDEIQTGLQFIQPPDLQLTVKARNYEVGLVRRHEDVSLEIKRNINRSLALLLAVVKGKNLL